MKVKPLRPDLSEYLQKHNLTKKFQKLLIIFETNPSHPSLHMEILEPRSLKIYSIRLDRKYRIIFVITEIREAEIIDINNHYR